MKLNKLNLIEAGPTTIVFRQEQVHGGPWRCGNTHQVLNLIFFTTFTIQEFYSSVPNRRAGQNKHAGGKILEKH